MEHALEGSPSSVTLLIVILALNALSIIAKIAWDIFNKKSASSDKAVIGFTEIKFKMDSFEKEFARDFARISASIEGFNKIDHRVMNIERELNEISKFRNDFNALFAGLKIIAGPKWPKVARAIRESGLGALRNQAEE